MASEVECVVKSTATDPRVPDHKARWLQRAFEGFLASRDVFFEATKALKPPLSLPPGPSLLGLAA